MFHVCCWPSLRLFASGIRGDFRIRRFNSDCFTLSHLCTRIGLQFGQSGITATNAFFLRNACHAPISAGRQQFITFFLIFLSLCWEENSTILQKELLQPLHCSVYVIRGDQMKPDSSEDNSRNYIFLGGFIFFSCKWCLNKGTMCHTELAYFENKSNGSHNLPRFLSVVSF